MYTFKMSEQRKLWNKQYDSEICCTGSLYSFFHSNKIANTWRKKVELILVAIVRRSVPYDSPLHTFTYFSASQSEKRDLDYIFFKLSFNPILLLEYRRI